MLSKALLGASKAASPVYVEDVFSTYLYTGNGSIQTINNGIALGSSYGGSVYFDGVGYLTVPDNAAFEMTGDFTVEAFFNCTAIPSAFGDIVTKGAAGIYQPYYIFVNGSGNLLFYSSSNGTSWNVASAVSFGTISTNTWYHVAVARQGSSMRLFLNGALITTITNSAALFDNTRAVGIGARSDGTETFTGYISNVRIVKGTAVYTAAFTVPTSPLTAVSGTSLLTCQSPSPTTDYSSNAFTVSVFTGAISQNGGGPFTNLAANKGGLVWIKGRSAAADAHALYDTVRGATFDLASNSSAAQTTQATGLTEFNSSGFRIGALAKLNTNADTYASWTFRKQDRFFDVRTVSHINGTADTVDFSNLGTLGLVIFKDTGVSQNWFVWHRTLTGSDKLQLNSTAAAATSTAFTVSGTTVTVTSSATTGTKLLYAFAHNAGGFGATGTDNAIFCGTFTTDVSGNASVTLGWEPQWLLFKSSTDGTNNWTIRDNLRGFNATDNGASLLPNTTGAEASASIGAKLITTGFTINSGGASSTYIYMAIRRPMKTPTSGTSVLGLNARTGTGAIVTVTGGANTTDLAVIKNRGSALGWVWTSRLTATGYVASNSNAAEVAAGATILQTNPWDVMEGVKVGTTSTLTNAATNTYINYLLERAPGFFDVVCDTGTASQHTVNHNLAVVPELIIRKKRNSATNSDWVVWHTLFTGSSDYLLLNTTDAVAANGTFWTTTPPTSTVFTVGTGSRVNNLNDTYITFLFASIPGVSKVGSYTGNGTSQTINCAFTTGARFVIIKREDALGNWFLWDTARGIVSGNDPRLVINSAAAEVTGIDDIDPDTSGFIINQASAQINTSGGIYIFLAIA